MKTTAKPIFAPQLYIPNGVTTIDFYLNGLGAVELRRWSNDDGSIHVSELSIDGAIFHLHEQKPSASQFDPITVKGSTTMIGLFVEDVDLVMSNARAAGAVITNAAKDYDYGYRQGEFKDPFGHYWLIEKKT
jgi:PhnB protein